MVIKHITTMHDHKSDGTVIMIVNITAAVNASKTCQNMSKRFKK